MVNKRGVAQAGTGAVYVLFPVLFFCFVLYHTLVVTMQYAREVERSCKRREERESRGAASGEEDADAPDEATGTAALGV
jgi:hypothetical protein